jgi:hypothetical protein
LKETPLKKAMGRRLTQMNADSRRLIAGDCKPPNALVIPFTLELKAK